MTDAAFEPMQIGGVIGRVMEDGSLLIAADDDMEEGAWKIESRPTSHAGSLGLVRQ